MDCSKSEVFFAEWHRMCDEFPVGETDACPLKMKGFVTFCMSCRSTVYEKSEKAIKIVQEWSDAHPVETRLSVFVKQYPKHQKKAGGLPITCAKYLYDVECLNDCAKCWNTPIEDGENNG